MAYVKNDWQTGDIITADKLNHMEQGIADYQVGPKGEPGTPGTDGAKGDPGLGVKSIALTTDASGKVTGGTLTLSDNSTSAITVTVAEA